MKVDFSKDFTKALDKLSGKIHHSVVEAINNVIDAQTLDDISSILYRGEKPTTKRIWKGSERKTFNPPSVEESLCSRI